MVDAGAARALLRHGASLLPSGIVRAEGRFDRGSSVGIVSADGITIGRGIANYPAEDVRKIMGRQSSEIDTILGYDYGDYVIHRDNMVCLEVGERLTHA
jgi:glutamate 5-kinase